MDGRMAEGERWKVEGTLKRRDGVRMQGARPIYIFLAHELAHCTPGIQRSYST